MKIKLLSVCCLIGICAIYTAQLFAIDYEERMLTNDIHNDITHMRLQSMMAGKENKQQNKDPLGPWNKDTVFNDDCNLNIGNNTAPQGLLTKPQTIVITGPVVNKCR